MEPPDVVWASTGLDRIHVPTGTAWRFCGDRHNPSWQHESGAEISRDYDGKWRSPGVPRPGVEHPTEGAIMAAALAAAGWTP